MAGVQMVGDRRGRGLVGLASRAAAGPRQQTLTVFACPAGVQRNWATAGVIRLWAFPTMADAREGLRHVTFKVTR